MKFWGFLLIAASLFQAGVIYWALFKILSLEDQILILRIAAQDRLEGAVHDRESLWELRKRMDNLFGGTPRGR